MRPAPISVWQPQKTFAVARKQLGSANLSTLKQLGVESWPLGASAGCGVFSVLPRQGRLPADGAPFEALLALPMPSRQTGLTAVRNY